MDDFIIRKLENNEEPPMALLLEADPSRRAIEEYLSRGEAYVLVVGGNVIGVYILIRTRPMTAELVNIAVADRFRGLGWGKRLLEHAVERARAMEAATLEVGTGNSSLDQLGFYQRCGFRIVGVDRNFFVRHYPEPIVENGIPCRDMIRLEMELFGRSSHE